MRLGSQLFEYMSLPIPASVGNRRACLRVWKGGRCPGPRIGWAGFHRNAVGVGRRRRLLIVTIRRTM